MIKAASAKVIGRSHVFSRTPCQDAVRTRNLRSKACIALADGAGSKRYSKLGANAMVRWAVHFSLEDFDRIYDGILGARDEVADEIATQCKVILQEKANKRKCLISELASTLLFFACDKNRYIAGHIGDGAIIARFGSRLVTLSEPQNGEYSNVTFFVTDSDASRHLRLYAGEYDGDFGVTLMSDGTAESLYNKLTRKAGSGVSRLFDLFVNLSALKMTQVLQSNLEQVLSEKSFDDCSITMLISSRRGESYQKYVAP